MRARRHTVVYWTGFSVILVLLTVAPLVLPEFWRRFLTEILIWGLLAMSSDLLIGYTGMVSFGHSAFFGLGMYGAAAALIAVITSSEVLVVKMSSGIFMRSIHCLGRNPTTIRPPCRNAFVAGIRQVLL